MQTASFCKVPDRVRAWQIVKAASEQADVRVLAIGATAHGAVGEPARVHPHRAHARVRPMQTEYFFPSDDEAQRVMRGVPE